MVQRLKSPLLALAAVLATVVSLADAQAPVKLYVATNGDDAGAGTQLAPFRTISKAVSLVQAGQTVLVRGGIYLEAVIVTVSGTETAPIIIAAYPGEHPIIDGEKRLPTNRYDPLVRLKGAYLHLDGFEIRNSKDAGLMLDGDHDIASHVIVHHSMEAGVIARGDNTIVEDSTIWQNAYKNCRTKDCPPTPYQGGEWATGLSAARNPVGGITHHATLRRNTSFNNWGEGISSYEAEGTLMEDNVSYDNWATNYYISDSWNVLFQRNLAYISSAYTDGRNRQCIQLADERKDKPRSRNNVIINNLCLNGSIDVFSWTDVPQSGLVDDLIANNTVLNGWLKVGSTSKPIVNSNSRFVNNLFLLGGKTAGISSSEGIEFSHNLWSEKPPAVALGTDSIVADALLAAPAVVEAGKVERKAFVPLAKSPAREAGLALPTVSTDALGHPRGVHPSIGAIEIYP